MIFVGVFFSLRKDLCNLLLRVHHEWMRDKHGLQRIFSEQFCCQGYTSSLVKLKLEVACLTVHMFILLACYTLSFSGCKSFQTMIVFLDALCERARK